ncbi:cytochrome c [Microbulbifer halophilus]|uniref:Cytochrome c n=1 Tax=Microbulbifer halophilus TaxID=453963 RepID=A0ABW5EGR4_9GAMM|nr:cytochrome c [Microbulbifer halophilus]MCW8128466.1 cytochrome c [Microbulbifer halophilus]
MGRTLATVLVVVLIILAALFFLIRKPSIAAVETPGASSFSAEQVERGRVLAGIGNCATCHTVNEDDPYAGGREFPTGFGSLYATNITPHPEDGIGNWSREAFVRSMREGVARDGSYLYPAFPYTHFKNLTDEDLDALYAYLMTREPVAYTPPENALHFPFNLRFLQWGWQLLFFSRDPLQPDPQQSDDWNRGAYLAEGAGHCTACHSPRNAFGAEKKDKAYAGALVDNWYAPALNTEQPVPVHWDSDTLYDYLREGQTDYQGVAVGSMGEVVHQGLERAPDSDIRAIAIYLASLAGPEEADGVDRQAGQIIEAAHERTDGDRGYGENVYMAACAACHYNAADNPIALRAELSLNSAVTAADPTNLLRVLLQGIPANEGTPGVVMPDFARLDNRDIVELAQFLRKRADRPAWDGLEKRLEELRQQTGTAAPHQGGSQ